MNKHGANIEIACIKVDRHLVYLKNPAVEFGRSGQKALRMMKRICRRSDRHEARKSVMDALIEASEPETYGSMIVAMLNEREDAILAEMIREGSL